MKHIKTFDDFINESNINELGPTKGTMTNFNLKDFKMFFGREYGHISHDIKDKDIQKFIDDNKKDRHNKPRALSSVADQFQDYLLSQGLADVQESKIDEAKNWPDVHDDLIGEFGEFISKLEKFEKEINGKVQTKELKELERIIKILKKEQLNFENAL